jgi:metal-responsive CopG/Arc/MetJ family transcriptional regulator
MVKVTFTLDDTTVERLRRLSARLKKPQSHVVREAVREYGERAAKLSDDEKTRLLKVFDTLVPAIPKRPQKEVDAELADIRAARRRWGKRPASGR